MESNNNTLLKHIWLHLHQAMTKYWLPNPTAQSWQTCCDCKRLSHCPRANISKTRGGMEMKRNYAKVQVSTCRTVETALVSADVLWRTFVVPLRLKKQYCVQLTKRFRFLLGPLSDRIVILKFSTGPLRGWKKAEIAAHGKLRKLLYSWIIEAANIQNCVCRAVNARYLIASNRLLYYPITILFFSVIVFRFLLLVNCIFVGGI